MAVRRRYPLAVGIVVPMLFAVQQALITDPQILASAVAYFCDLYALAVWTTTRRFAIGLVTLIAGSLLAALGPALSLANTSFFTVVSVIVMLLVRRVVGDRERRAQLAERERDVAAREAVVEERARIARELHDVIAHHVSMIVLQAGAERSVLDDSNASTRDVLETVERSGRSALTEMRRLLGMLRSDESDPLAPQPGLGDLPVLVDQLREAGLPVELKVEGERRTLPVGIELSAYRIVQEGIDERAQARRATRTHASMFATAPTRSSSRSPTTGTARVMATRPAADTALSACANGSRSTAVASRQIAFPTAASSSGSRSRSDDQRPGRRRPGTRPRRPPENPGERPADRCGGRSGRRPGRRLAATHVSDPM